MLCILCDLPLNAQDTVSHVQRQQVMFWNVENAFWPEEDPETDDDEFTPEGTRHWTRGRLRQKLTQLTRVILAAGGGRAPMLVGLAEVEGDSVMDYWTRHTSLWDQHYRYVVTHGPDQRGIQTALLYQPFDFRLISAEGHRVVMPDGVKPTRDVLHAAGRLVNGDTLDVLVCHLPSQLGGAKQSQPGRDAAHRTVMHVADSLVGVRRCPRVIVMGDMNDTPSARRCWWGRGFCNLMLPLQRELKRKPGCYASHKYQGEWGWLDQFIIDSIHNSEFIIHDSIHNSEFIIHNWSPRTRVGNARAFALPFMLTADEVHLGHRPRRSYYGYRYEGGLSDHLPILLDLDICY